MRFSLCCSLGICWPVVLIKHQSQWQGLQPRVDPSHAPDSWRVYGWGHSQLRSPHSLSHFQSRLWKSSGALPRKDIVYLLNDLLLKKIYPGALQLHSRLPYADAEQAPPYSSGAQPAWTSCETFLTCSPAEREGRAPAPTFPGSSELLSFPGGNDLHTWPQRTEKNLTKEIPDLRGVRLGNTFLQLPGGAGHVTLLCGQLTACQSTSKLERLLCFLKRDCFRELKVSSSLNLPEHGMIGTING